MSQDLSTALHPADRYQSADELARALRDFIAGRATIPSNTTVSPRIVMRILRCTLSLILTYIATTVAQFIACQTTALSVSKRASKL